MNSHPPSRLHSTTIVEQTPKPEEPWSNLSPYIAPILKTHIAPLLWEPVHVFNSWIQFLRHIPDLYIRPFFRLAHASQLEQILHFGESRSYAATAYVKLCFASTIDPGDKTASVDSTTWKGVQNPWKVFPHTEACYNIPWGLMVVCILLSYIIWPLLWLVLWKLGLKMGFRGFRASVRWVTQNGIRGVQRLLREIQAEAEMENTLDTVPIERGANGDMMNGSASVGNEGGAATPGAYTAAEGSAEEETEEAPQHNTPRRSSRTTTSRRKG